MSNDLTLLVSRILLASLFLVSGIPLIFAPGGFAGYMGAIGLPAPLLITWVVIAVKVLGGLGILLGFKTRYAALALAGFSIATAFMGHFDWTQPNEINNFFKNFALAGGFIALIASGPGSFSVDKR